MNARLVVDLSVLQQNMARVREAVAPAEPMFVVKDDAYGHGIVQACHTAFAAGFRWFGAFDVRTGAAVRQVVGESARVFVWIAASEGELDTALDHDLDVGVGDAELLADVGRIAQSRQRVCRVHLKVDTGLHRNGVRTEDWPAFVESAASLQRRGLIDVVGLWSHIAEASDTEDDAARAAFEQARTVVERAGFGPVMCHLAASAASFARPEFRYDMVRVGAFCYGIRSAGGPSERSLGLALASRLEAEVVRSEDGRIAIGIGALDGIPSTLAGRASVGTPGGPRQILAIDECETVIAEWSGARAGQTVRLYGPGEQGEGSVTDLAELIDTIGEEVAVRVSPLVQRTYAE